MVVFCFFAFGLVAGGLALTFLTSWVWALPFYLLAAFCLYFFRDPDREIPQGTGRRLPCGRQSCRRETEHGFTRLSIFLSIFDVH